MRRLSLIRIIIFAVISILVVSPVVFSSEAVDTISINNRITDENLLTERFSRALKYQTVSQEDRAQFNQEAFLGFQKFLEQSFPKAHRIMKKEIVGDYSLLYKWQGRDDKALPILLVAHMDVVPADTASGGSWSYPPFQGQIADGFIWGRGTLDDKVSMVGIFEAVEKLLQEEYVPDRTIYLAFGHDEEIGGRRGAATIAELLNSRGLKLEYVLDEGFTIIEDMMPGIAKAVALIGIAEKGCVSIELSVESEGGHSMMPPRETAIGILSTAVSKLEKNQFPLRMEAPVKKMFETLAPEMSVGLKTVFSNLWLFGGLVEQKLASVPRTNALVRTTVAPTIFQAGVKENVLATKARAVVNYRLLPGDTIHEVWLHVRKTVNDPRVQINILDGLTSEPSRIADTESRGYKSVEQAVRKVFPQVLVAPGLVMGATDSRYYAAMTGNVLHFIPVRLRSDDLSRIHGVNERISIENYNEVVKFYMQLLRNE